MTPTETLIAVALTATLFGFAIRHAWAGFHFDKDATDLIARWESMYRELLKEKTRTNFASASYGYTQGFLAGVKMADDEEAEDEMLEEEVTWPYTPNLKRFQPIFPTLEEINQLLTKTNFNR